MAVGTAAGDEGDRPRLNLSAIKSLFRCLSPAKISESCEVVFCDAVLVFDKTGNTADKLGAGELAKPGKLRQCFRPRVVRPAVASREVGFEFSHRELFPFAGLPEQRPALVGTVGRGLTIQRGDRAIPPYVFHDSFPAHP